MKNFQLKGEHNVKMGWYPSVFSREYQVVRAQYDARIRNWSIDFDEPFFIVTDSDDHSEYVFYDGKIANCTCKDFIRIQSSSCMHIEALKRINPYDIKLPLLKSKQYDKRIKYIDFISRNIIERGDNPLVLPSVKLFEKYKNNIQIKSFDTSNIINWDVFADFGINIYDYQEESIKGMLRNRRTVLTLKMGLGKTICALACCKILTPQKVLIIAPNNLKYQWLSEIKRFNLGEAIVVDKKTDISKINNHKFVILSYELLNRNLNDFEQINYDILIADEIQKIKNPDSVSWKTMSKIKTNFIFALSGTPIQNSIDDILAIIRFLNPNEFQPQWKFYVDYCDFTKAKLLGIKQNKISAFREHISRYIINPNVKPKIKLPQVNEKLIVCDLDDDSARCHNSYIDSIKPLMAKTFNYPLTFAEKAILNSLLTKARMSVTDSRLINELNGKSERFVNIELTISEILKRGEKVVIYSEWIKATELLIEYLITNNIQYSIFNGALSAKKRNSELNKFINNDDVKVFLSTDSGGLGIDGLQLVCNNIIHIEKMWNPAKVKQRNGRLVRNLQKKDIVNIYNFTCDSEIELMMDNTITRKEVLIDEILF